MASDIGNDGKHEDRGGSLVGLYNYVFGADSQKDAARMLALKKRHRRLVEQKGNPIAASRTTVRIQ